MVPDFIFILDLHLKELPDDETEHPHIYIMKEMKFEDDWLTICIYLIN